MHTIYIHSFHKHILHGFFLQFDGFFLAGLMLSLSLGNLYICIPYSSATAATDCVGIVVAVVVVVVVVVVIVGRSLLPPPLLLLMLLFLHMVCYWWCVYSYMQLLF